MLRASTPKYRTTFQQSELRIVLHEIGRRGDPNLPTPRPHCQIDAPSRPKTMRYAQNKQHHAFAALHHESLFAQKMITETKLEQALLTPPIRSRAGVAPKTVK